MTESQKIRVRVLCFAGTREVVGSGSLELDLPEGASVEALREQLYAQYRGLRLVPFVFAVNQDYADESRPLDDGDEVALVPAISGG